MNRLFILSALFVLTTERCTTKKNISSNENAITTTNTETPTPQLDATQPIYNSAETRVTDLLHTQLKVKFDWENKRLLGQAELKLAPYAYPSNRLVLDAKAMDIIAINRIGDSIQTELPFQYNGSQLNIKLPRKYDRNEAYTISIEYIANPEKVQEMGSSAITEAKGLYFINADGADPKKHTEIWTQGETESNSVWFPTIDAPNEKTTQEIFITVDDKYTTLSNGLLISSNKNADGTRTDYWKMDQPHAPYLFMMAIGEYAIVRDSIQKMDGSRMEVNYYVEEKFEKHAKAIFGKTPKMIQYFSQLLGVEYPWPKYSQVVVRDYVSGAMENTTATIHGEFLYKTTRELIDEDNESIIAHELFHHWFGDLVTCESWSNLPLNESFANYSQFLWDEYEYDRMEADKNAYEEMEGYFLSAQQGGHVDMIRFDYKDKGEMFDGHSYNKGGRILHMLRTYLGDEVFFRALKNYLTDNAYTATEIHELRMQFEKASGKDLNWFFNQWFLSSGHPIVDITQTYDSTHQQLTIEVIQKQNVEKWPLYQLPITIDIYTNGNVVSEEILVKNQKNTFVFDLTTPPDLVNMDATKTTLWKKIDKKPLEQWIYQLNHAPLWLDKKEAFDKLKRSSNKEVTLAILNALDHDFYDVKLMAIKYIANTQAKHPEQVKSKLISLFQSDTNSKVRSTSLTALIKYYPELSEIKTLLTAGLKDESYLVLGASLKGHMALMPENGLEEAKKYEALENASLNIIIASIYADYGSESEHAFFVGNVSQLNGMNRFSFLQYYLTFLTHQENDETAKGLQVFEDQIAGNNMWFLKLAGYQLMTGLQTHFFNRAAELDTEIMSQQRKGAKTEEVLVLEKEKNFCISQDDLIQQKLKFYIQKETDPNVLQYLPKE